MDQVEDSSMFHALSLFHGLIARPLLLVVGHGVVT
jgi:hypothetical protein